MSMRDEELLPWVGLDGFIMIQTIKLILGLLLMLCIPGFAMLLPVYYYGSDSTEGWFKRLSTMSVNKPRLLWVTLVYNYYAAIVVFYGLYTFYRNLSIYRQSFLRSPGCCISQVTMRRLARNVGSVDSARKLIDLTSRAAVVTNVSSKYSKTELMGMFEEMGLRDISSIVIVQNRSTVRKMLIRRNRMLGQLEADLRTMYTKMLQHVAWGFELPLEDISNSYYSGAKRIGLEERKRLLRKLLSEEVLTRLRPRHKEGGEEVDSISWRYRMLIQHDDELLEAANRFATDNERFLLDMDPGSPIFLEETGSVVSDDEPVHAGQGLVSFRQLFQLKTNVKDYGLTLWGTSMSIIVVFGSQHSATIAEQTLLSCRPFSMEVIPAPQADDIIWDNLYKPAADRTVHQLFGDLLYVMINVLFTSANIAISTFLKVDRFESKYPALKHWFDTYPRMRSIVSGILAPLFYNLFLLIAPYMLYGLSIYQGKVSKTEVQQSLLQKYTWLLFIQTFVLFLLSWAFVVVLEKLISGQYGDIVRQLMENLPNNAAFFMNIILQRAAISLMLLLIKPAALLFMFITRIFWRDNIRMRALAMQPDRIFIGALYPEYVVYVFMVTLAFMPVTPIICLASLAFYSFAYLVFRYHFIFTYEIAHESGGRYWMFLPTPILVGCITGQIFSIIQLSFINGTVQALSMTPLLIISVGLIIFIRRVFERRSHYLPLGPEASGRSTRLSEQMQEKQGSTVHHIAMESGEGVAAEEEGAGGPGERERDGLMVGERNFETVPYDFGTDGASRLLGALHEGEALGETSAAENPYCNPIMFKRFSELMLPASFFHVLRDSLDVEEEIAPKLDTESDGEGPTDGKADAIDSTAGREKTATTDDDAHASPVVTKS